MFEPRRGNDDSSDDSDDDDDASQDEDDDKGTYRNVAVLSSSRGDEYEMGSTDDGWEMVS